MATFNYPVNAVAGAAIKADDHQQNWDYLKNYINGNPNDLINYPGLLEENNPSATGNITLGSSTSSFYLSGDQNDVIGLGTGTSITGETAGQFLKDLNYRANWTGSGAPGGAGPGNNTAWLSYGSDVASGAFAGNYETESHRYSVYSRRAGEGYQGPYNGRPASEYRLVINGSMAIRGDIIGYTSKNESNPGTSTDYEDGEGTRIDCQWLNVGANIDCGGELRVQSSYDFAKIYLGNDYSLQDYIEWHDNLDGLGNAGLAFGHNDLRHIQFIRSGSNLDMRTVIAPTGDPAVYPGTTQPNANGYDGWPTLTGAQAVIATGQAGTNPDIVHSQQLGISSSSIRFKEDVQDIDVEENWTKLRALKPRTFRWNEEVSTNSGMDYETQAPEPGFIAEEVHEAAPDTTLYDPYGDPIVYKEKSMLAMLVKAVQDIDNRLGALE